MLARRKPRAPRGHRLPARAPERRVHRTHRPRSGLRHRLLDAVHRARGLPESLGRLDGAYAGLWLSHVPVGRRREFIASPHRLLAPGARVAFLDNSAVQCREIPITERDDHGNTYQHRRLKDGSVHRVLKNFPSQGELEALVAGFGVRPPHRELQNFWLFEYAATGASCSARV